MPRPVMVGADPELFLVKNSLIIPACGLIGGTKKNPVRMSAQLSPKYKMLEDNILCEFNIPPTTSANRFANAIKMARQQLNQFFSAKGIATAVVSSAMISVETLNKHKDSREFGCDPDFDAHNYGAQYPKFDPSEWLNKEKTHEIRFAGGHIHIGYEQSVPPFVAAALADVFIGLPMINYDHQEQRRKYYGQAGRYRPKPYGIEYRTPSNLWLEGTALTIGHLAFNLGHFLQGSTLRRIKDLYQKTPWDSVKEAINTENSFLGSQIIDFLTNQCGFDELSSSSKKQTFLVQIPDEDDYEGPEPEDF